MFDSYYLPSRTLHSLKEKKIKENIFWIIPSSLHFCGTFELDFSFHSLVSACAWHLKVWEDICCIALPQNLRQNFNKDFRMGRSQGNEKPLKPKSPFQRFLSQTHTLRQSKWLISDPYPFPSFMEEHGRCCLTLRPINFFFVSFGRTPSLHGWENCRHIQCKVHFSSHNDCPKKPDFASWSCPKLEADSNYPSATATREMFEVWLKVHLQKSSLKCQHWDS